jgi:tetratricopeptide (TPR) repeat protein
MINKTLTVAATASLLEDVAKSAYRQSDLRIVREGMPSYLMLIDGMVQALPDNERLLISAKEYALRALERIGFKDPLSKSFDDFEKDLHAFGQKKDVPYLFWAASCWGNWISLNQDSIEAVAELPRVELLVKRVLELDEGFYYGGAHIFMGVLWASKPQVAGGDLNRAKEHFLKAIELGRGEFLLTYIYYADYYARKAFDKELFIATLETVLKTPADITPDLTLLNTVAQAKAKKMITQVDEYF